MWLEMRGRFLRISRKKETHTPVLFFERAKTHSPLKDVPSHSPRHSLWGSLASVSARGNFSRPSPFPQSPIRPTACLLGNAARKKQEKVKDELAILTTPQVSSYLVPLRPWIHPTNHGSPLEATSDAPSKGDPKYLCK